MSEFRVQTATIEDHALRLGSIAPELADVGGRLGARAGAAASTPAAGAVSDTTEHLSSGLVGFGAAADALLGAMVAAAAEYSRADADVERWAR